MNCPSGGIENPVEARFCMACGFKLAVAQPTVASDKELLTSSGFVGRREEMLELQTALEAGLSGEGRLVMLVGEPGIGKTRTAQELAGFAESQGAQVSWGRCYEGEGAPPYWPWVQILRDCLERSGSKQIGADMGVGAADIATILPQLWQTLTDLQSPLVLDPEQARFRLFDSITTFLKNASNRRPLMVVLDDLHWADNSTLLLLEFVVHELSPSLTPTRADPFAASHEN